ncbi:MAG: DHA2 family efflux MFS transporter permease subunit [Candidatus Omnitrophica bacterium]|nr:DHA2 family efflux MFS transporter permease subunit [Candidatus Omnitrophota bacterium]
MNKWIVALSVILPTLIEVIDTSVVNVSLDHIRGSLSAGIDEATWTITAYLVSNAIIIPITGWLSRVFGRKNYLTFSVGLFTLSSFLCGSSKTLSQLIFFRIMQGVGGGALQPISQAILLETFPVAQHGMAMALFGVGVMFGPIIGPIVGGWITDNWSWNWIFYINIPIGVISMLMIMFFIRDPHYLQRIKAKIDYWGLVLIAVGLGSLQIILDKGQRLDWLSSAFIFRLSIISAASLILFIIVELRSSEPVVNLRVFKNISFTSGNLIQFIAFFVLFGSIVLIPMYLQQLMGYNAMLAGLALAPGGIATLISMPIAGRLVTKINPKFILATGIIITSYSTFLMAQFNLYTNFDIVAWSRIGMGFGMGLVFIPLVNMTLSSIKKEEMGNATGVFNLLRNLGGSFGVAFVTTLLARRSQFHQSRLVENLNPFDQRFQLGASHSLSILQYKGITGAAQAKGIIYQRLLRESSMNSFVDAFFISTLLLLCILPLVLFIKKVKKEEGAVPIH